MKSKQISKKKKIYLVIWGSVSGFDLALTIFTLILSCCCAAAHQSVSPDYDQLIVNASSLLKDGSLDEAKKNIQQAIKLNATNYLAYAVAAKIASKQGDTEEACQFVQKALELAPDEDKDKVQELAEQIQPTSSSSSPTQSNELSDEDRLTLNVLLLLLDQADQATTPEDRENAFSDFLSRSADFAKAHPEQTNIWVMRAFTAINLNRPHDAWEAGQHLKALGLMHSDDPKVGKIFGELDLKGWLDQEPKVAVVGSANNSTDLPLVGDKARQSYAVGMYMAKGWKSHGLDLDLDILLRGTKDEQAGGPTLLTQPEMDAALTQLRQSVMQHTQKVQPEAAIDSADTPLVDDKSRQSYAVGMYLASGWKSHGVDVDLDIMFRGAKDEMSGGPTLLTQPEMSAALQQLRQEAAMRNQSKGQTNLQEGTAFLEQNKTKPEVITLPDGLQYKVIREGTGPTPTANDIVKVNYRGTFIDGTEFDSSAKAGHPIEIPVRGVIPGWTEALEKMNVGSKWQIFIPSNLAYGLRGAGLIGPNQALIFDIELLDVKQGPPAPPPPQPLTTDIIKVPSAEQIKNGAQIETIKADTLR